MSGQITINSSILQILVKRVRQPVGEAATRQAALHLLDWLGAALAGCRHPGAAGFVAALSGAIAGPCTALSGEKVDWWQALQPNAAVGNLFEMDDLHRTSILHPGPVIIPAAIAVAEKTGASGASLLAAIVRGYEATIRIGQALGTSHYAYFHNTSTCGTFGAAAAAASLLELSEQQTVWALANAGSRTGGLWQMRHEACETKSLHNVMAAQTGVQAALLATQGVRGPANLLEGAQGLFAALSDGADPALVVDDISADWRIHQVSFKPWPACRHAHPVIDAALAVRSEIGTSEIQKVEVRTYQSALDFCDQPNPVTEGQAKFSLQHCAAVALINGAPTFADFAVDHLNDPAVAAMRGRVVAGEDAAFTRVFPQHYGAHIKVTLADGRVLQHLQADAYGDPELPMHHDDIVIKATTLIELAGMTNAVQLIAATLNMANAPDISGWTRLWTVTPPVALSAAINRVHA